MIFPHAPYTLSLFDDPTYSLGSADNVRTYDHAYALDRNHPQSISSKHGLQVFSSDDLTASAILLGEGGSTGVHGRSLVVVGDRVYVCVGNAVAALVLPHLVLDWFQKVDDYTAFQIFAIPDGLIVHGELSISRITGEGSVVWQHHGSDIFVTPTGENDFSVQGDTIHAQSWDGRKYRIQMDGSCTTEVAGSLT